MQFPLAQPIPFQPPPSGRAIDRGGLIKLHKNVEAMEKHVASDEANIFALQHTLKGLQAQLQAIKGKAAQVQHGAETSTDYVRHLTIQRMDLQKEVDAMVSQMHQLEVAVPDAKKARETAKYRLQTLQELLEDQYDNFERHFSPLAPAVAAPQATPFAESQMTQKSAGNGELEIEHCKEHVAHLRKRLRKLAAEQRKLEEQKDAMVAEVEEARKQAGGDTATETHMAGNANLARSDRLRLENGNLKQKLDELQAEVQSKTESNRKARAEEEATISKLIAEKEALQAPVGGADSDDATETHMKSFGGVFMDKAKIQQELHEKVKSYEMENAALKRKLEQSAKEASAQAKANLDALIAQRDSLKAKLETIHSKPPRGSKEVRTAIGSAGTVAYSNLNQWNKHLLEQIEQASGEKAKMQQDLEGLKAQVPQPGKKQAWRDPRISPTKAGGRLVQKSIDEKVANRGEKDSHGSSGFWKGAAQRLMDGIVPKQAQVHKLATANEKLHKDLQPNQAELAGLFLKKTLAEASKSWKR